METLWFLAGAVSAGVAVWFLRKAREAEAVGREREERVRLEVQAREAEKKLVEQRALLDEAQARLKESFRATAGEALQGNSQAFLQMAEKALDVRLEGARGDLELRKHEVEKLVEPLREMVKAYQQKIEAIEGSRAKDFGGLNALLDEVRKAQEKLKEETGHLVSALRQPNVRGQWGELTLRRVVELAGLSAHCDFTEQPTGVTEGRISRPDVIIHMPGKREVVVDAKAVLTHYLDAQEAATEEARKTALGRHAQDLRNRIKDLSARNYASQFGSTVDFVILFVPHETFLAAAAQEDRDLVEFALERKVILATPVTLVALLKAVAVSWQQAKMAENVEEVQKIGGELASRIATWMDHMDKMGRALGAAVGSFNSAQSSLEARVLPQARRMKELGARTDREVPRIEPVTEQPRAVTQPEPEVRP